MRPFAPDLKKYRVKNIVKNTAFKILSTAYHCSKMSPVVYYHMTLLDCSSVCKQHCTAVAARSGSGFNYIIYSYGTVVPKLGVRPLKRVTR